MATESGEIEFFRRAEGASRKGGKALLRERMAA
jgi:hypothetical protein